VADPTPIAVVLTAISVEHKAVSKHLVDMCEDIHRSGTIFDRGRLPNGSWQVVLAQTGPGNLPAAIVADQAISRYRPDLLMFVGVAGRLHTDLSRGDVVVAKKVYAIHSGTEGPAGFLARPEVWRPHHGHTQRAERVAGRDSWQDMLLPGQERTGARAFVRAIASGEVVLDSARSSLAGMIKKHYADAAAIEMEGAGVAAAGHHTSLPVVVVRGISDDADGHKAEADKAGWQQRAAQNAAAFAVALLAELVPARTIEEDLLSGASEQRIAAIRELADGRYENAVPILVKGFEATLDHEVSCRVVWALRSLETAEAKEALRALKPRYEIERLAIEEALASWPEQP
jgi:nucleoside phosphorylase